MMQRRRRSTDGSCRPAGVLLVMSFLLALQLLSSCAKNPQKGGVDTFVAPNGRRIVITCIKHASLEINYRGKEFEIDPVFSAVRPIVDYTDKPQADYILVTHDHYDHFDMNAVFLLTKNNTQVFLTQRCFNRYQRGTVIRNGETYRLDTDMTLRAVPAYNLRPDHRSRHPRGVGNGYLLELGGFRIYIAGDTELVPEMRYLGRVDVAFLPCDSANTMSIKELRQSAKVIRPKVLYPYHLFFTPPAEVEKALRGLGIEVRMRDLR